MRPFPYDDVERVIREELGQPIERLFLEFDEVPLAAASIGQVHRAVLPNGRRVAVKVQRPRAPQQVESDIQLLYQAARLVHERVRALDFLDTREIVDEFARSIRQELDYRQEGRNADAFHVNFAGHPHVAVPRVYWSYTRARVLTHGAPRRRPALGPRARRVADRAAPPARVHRRRRVDDDDLPARLLPRRPAPGEHPRALARADRPRRLRPLRQADRPRHVEADAALHRRDERERRGCCRSGWPTSASATRASARRSSSPSCTRCTRATTARPCARSTRCR